MKFTVIKKEGTARRGVFETVHGTVQTPAFMNVATCGAIKGAVSSYDLKDIHCQVQLCNTYHLHLRPGDELVKEFGGLHKFTGWDGPILTDSGGFQVFSLAGLRKIKEEGVTFQSHLDGSRHFIGPEESMDIQQKLGSDICMAFDVCSPYPCDYNTAKINMERTHRWAERCKKHHTKEDQALFGIVQDVFLTKHYRKIYDAEDAVRLQKALEQERIEAEKERVRAERRASNPDGITANTSKKKLEKQQRDQEQAAKAAAAKEYAARKGIVEEVAQEENAPLSGVSERPFCKGRNYDPDRYAPKSMEE